MFQKWSWRELRGSSREPDDLALGTKRPGDFIEPEEGEELILPEPTRRGRAEGMLRKLLRSASKLKSVQAGDGQRSVDNVDAMASDGADTGSTRRAVLRRPSRPTT